MKRDEDCVFFFSLTLFFFSFGFIKRKVFYLWDIHGNYVFVLQLTQAEMQGAGWIRI